MDTFNYLFFENDNPWFSLFSREKFERNPCFSTIIREKLQKIRDSHDLFLRISNQLELLQRLTAQGTFSLSLFSIEKTVSPVHVYAKAIRRRLIARFKFWTMHCFQRSGIHSWTYYSAFLQCFFHNIEIAIMVGILIPLLYSEHEHQSSVLLYGSFLVNKPYTKSKRRLYHGRKMQKLPVLS